MVFTGQEGDENLLSGKQLVTEDVRKVKSLPLRSS